MMYKTTAEMYFIDFLAFKSADPLWITISENDPHTNHQHANQ